MSPRVYGTACIPREGAVGAPPQRVPAQEPEVHGVHRHLRGHLHQHEGWGVTEDLGDRRELLPAAYHEEEPQDELQSPPGVQETGVSEAARPPGHVVQLRESAAEERGGQRHSAEDGRHLRGPGATVGAPDSVTQREQGRRRRERHEPQRPARERLRTSGKGRSEKLLLPRMDQTNQPAGRTSSTATVQTQSPRVAGTARSGNAAGTQRRAPRTREGQDFSFSFTFFSKTIRSAPLSENIRAL